MQFFIGRINNKDDISEIRTAKGNTHRSALDEARRSFGKEGALIYKTVHGKYIAVK